MLITATAVDPAGRPVSRAAVLVLILRNGRSYASARAAAGAAGRRLPAAGSPRRLLHDDDQESLGGRLRMGRSHAAQPLLPASC